MVINEFIKHVRAGNPTMVYGDGVRSGTLYLCVMQSHVTDVLNVAAEPRISVNDLGRIVGSCLDSFGLCT